MDVSVVIGTYGDGPWKALSWERAMPSARGAGAPIVHGVHGETLHEARNEGLAKVTTEWVCFLDADDELEPGYFDAMDKATADMRAPKVRYVKDGLLEIARHPMVAGHRHQCHASCLMEGNWLVIGTVVRTDLVRLVGGFRDWPIYEDFDLWVRCWETGATVEAVDAVYRAHVRQDSRNRAPDRAARLAAHQAIARANGLPVPA